VLVTVRDVTTLRTLQAQAINQSRELSYIDEIIGTSTAEFNRFMGSSHAFHQKNVEIIDQPVLQNADLNTLFINLHTMKGNARTLKLKLLTEAVHNTESLLSGCRSMEKVISDQTRGDLKEKITGIGTMLSEYKHISEKKLNRSSEKIMKSISHEELETELLALLLHDRVAGATEQKELIQKTRSSLYRICFPSLRDLLSNLIESAEDLAAKLDKQPPRISFEGNQAIGFRSSCHAAVQDIFLHLVRNSLDHGIESTDDRLRAGKNPQGLLTIDIDDKRHAEYVLVSFMDDGRGLDISKIRRKAMNCKLIEEGRHFEPSQIAQLIFESGLSTAENVSDISGRGVGMSAVREFLNRIEGSIEIELLDNEPDQEFMKFAFRILIPKNLCVPYEPDNESAGRWPVTRKAA
ncbi:MAG: Hpt domain-containing protein, partial [Oligoflexales bacterium]|nr:Hpt domain-containing protein [Oligoflexales bacterium]